MTNHIKSGHRKFTSITKSRSSSAPSRWSPNSLLFYSMETLRFRLWSRRVGGLFGFAFFGSPGFPRLFRRRVLRLQRTPLLPRVFGPGRGRGRGSFGGLLLGPCGSVRTRPVLGRSRAFRAWRGRRSGALWRLPSPGCGGSRGWLALSGCVTFRSSPFCLLLTLSLQGSYSVQILTFFAPLFDKSRTFLFLLLLLGFCCCFLCFSLQAYPLLLRKTLCEYEVVIQVRYNWGYRDAPASRLVSSSSRSRRSCSSASSRRRSSSRAFITAAVRLALASRSLSEASLCFSAYSWPLLSNTSSLVFLKSPNMRERRALVSRLSWCCCLELSMRAR